jgi:glycosyltransferase involved in cell wall biosynthesis
MLIGAFTCVKNEEQTILEWISHYIALGVQRIHVFDTGSTDNTAEILALSSRVFSGVTWESWKLQRGWHNAAFARGVKIMVEDGVDWAIACDADEFLCCERHAPLEQLLQYFDDSPAIGVNWAIYGSSGLIADPKAPLVGSFLYRAPDNFEAHHNIKSIIRPSMVSGVKNSHVFDLKGGHYKNCYRQNLEWIGSPGVAQHVSLTWRFNHYFCRNRDFWHQKVNRSIEALDFARRTDEDWIAHDKNEIYDETGLYYLQNAQSVLAGLGCCPKPDKPEPIGLLYASPPGVSSGGVGHEPISDGTL